MSFIAQKVIKNPDASIPLYIPIIVQSNTPHELVKENVRLNAALNLPWVGEKMFNGRAAIMCGGGPSLLDYIEQIKALQAKDGMVFAMNGASRKLNDLGIVPDYQVIADAKEETSTLVDPRARTHLFASQVHPKTMEAAERPLIWHTAMEGIESLFPPERVKRGGYALFGGGCGVGTCGMSVAYGLGHRVYHVFGYDSCNRDGKTHAYRQDMNKSIPCVEVEWAGKTYTASVGMYGHAAVFQRLANDLKKLGCSIKMYGEGLCQSMFLTKPEDLTEQDKYRLMWALEEYRHHSPGEVVVGKFLELTEPGTVIDFGCGTGRASIELARHGYSPFLVDFAENCRDEEAMRFPFVACDLTKPMYVRAQYGYCVDVMEHIPPGDVDAVIRNIMASAPVTFFQISTLPDYCGALIGATLHNTVRPHDWWRRKFSDLGFSVTWEDHDENACQLLINRRPKNGS